MRLNRGNRAFFALVAVAFVAYLLLGGGACVLFGSLVYGLLTGEIVAANLWGVLGLAVFLLLYVLGWVFAVGSFIRQVAATLKLRDRVRVLRLPISVPLRESERRVDLTGRVDLVDSDEAFSFTYGVFATRVAVSRGLLEKVSAVELDAVLTHERYHVRNRDPLKVFIARLVTRALFFLPVLTELMGRYVAGRELAADRRALKAYGERPLAGALYKVVSGPLWSELGAAAAIGGPNHLDARVAQLETGQEPAAPPIPREALLATIAGSAALALSFALAVVAFDSPMAMLDGSMMDTRHETRGGGWIWSATFWILLIAGASYLYWRGRRSHRRSV